MSGSANNKTNAVNSKILKTYGNMSTKRYDEL